MYALPPLVKMLSVETLSTSVADRGPVPQHCAITDHHGKCQTHTIRHTHPFPPARTQGTISTRKVSTSKALTLKILDALSELLSMCVMSAMPWQEEYFNRRM